MLEQLIIQKPDERAWEADLIALARRGDPVAFENLVKIHMKWAYGLAYRLSGEHFLADEISQEAFFVLYRSFGKFRGESRLKTYLTRIIINIWRQHLRGVYRQQDRDQRLARRQQRDENSLPRELKRDETREKIEEAIAKLPPAQKKIFILKHLEGMKIREVASATGCREGTVKAHLFKALRNLRKNLQ
ncbi:MAG: RNA polymerase sigma factor [Candidatus Omnitrophica bacterium]|nr:RNA polymerase sigma factor [Candidatus Omnitrophota bacterium]